MTRLAQARLALALPILRENVWGIAFAAVLLGACIFAIMRPAAGHSSPIISLGRATGTVVSVLDASPNPKGWINGGFRYLYGIRLSENDLIFVYGDAETPRAMGSQVPVEQQHRQDGSETYRLLDE
ncbi:MULTISPECIES: hypothetical protein [unclassified Mesorhizobium]|uniref:hypothetical protein n=1 Tax=unclassified Mesorhizobium TaxID=325217 RepID=UPI0004CF1BF9|nr:hypothetical protein [Mesorhizobium sp. LSHC412B00]